jgi:hypothetical protein
MDPKNLGVRFHTLVVDFTLELIEVWQPPIEKAAVRKDGFAKLADQRDLAQAMADAANTHLAHLGVSYRLTLAD